MKRFFPAAAVVTALAASLAGCGGGGAAPSSSTASSRSATLTGTTSTASATATTPSPTATSSSTSSAPAGPTQQAYATPYGPSAHPPGFALPSPGLAPKASGVLTGAPTAAMFDTITLSSMPSASAVRAAAGYTAGHWPTYLPLVHAFPHAKVISIAVGAGFHAMCLDIEPGDAVPSQAPGWYRAVKADGGIPKVAGKPCLYSSLSEFLTQVIPTMNSAGISRSSYWGWDADYTFIPHIDLGFDATQWTDHALGRNLDQSMATYAFLGLSLPTPAPSKPVCFGAHAQKSKTCSQVQAQVSGDGKAAAASQKAFVARGCPVLHQRDVYFSGALKKHPTVKTASRRRALAATRTAERQRSCSTFQQRATFFSLKAATLTKQYS